MSGARKAPLPNVRVGDRNLQAFLDGVRERLEVGAGERPRQSPLDQYVTRRDLANSSGEFDARQILTGGGGGGGGGGDGTFLHVDALSGLVVSGAVETVILLWGGTNQPNYSYTEIWRATVDDLGQAVLVGQTPAELFADDAQVTVGTTYYYWIRAVSKSGDPGPFNAVEGTPATPGLVGPGVIEHAAIDTAHIANAAIVQAKIAAAAIHSAQIANAAITYAKIADAAVDTAKIANAAINTAKIVDAAVDTLKIAGNAVTIPLSDLRGDTTVADYGHLESPSMGGNFPATLLGSVSFNTDDLNSSRYLIGTFSSVRFMNMTVNDVNNITNQEMEREYNDHVFHSWTENTPGGTISGKSPARTYLRMELIRNGSRVDFFWEEFYGESSRHLSMTHGFFISPNYNYTLRVYGASTGGINDQRTMVSNDLTAMLTLR